ncbi:MAG TPA: alpha/beta hydrolase [Baekduia sp.]|nr:alpha/beta hydrolase [Baekduia sp.]
MTQSGHVTALSPAVAALQRAMPISRLIDCGMAPEDADQLFAETAGGASWARSAAHIAEHRFGQSQRDRTDPRSEARTIRQAAAAWLFAQMAFNEDTERKRDLYRRYVETITRYAELRIPALERILVPYGAGHLVGWLALPAGGRADATVVVWGGLSGWGAAYLRLADALNQRGLACLLAEGPGQGEPRLNDRIFLDSDAVRGFARFVDAVCEDQRLGDRIGIQGNSFGGLFAGLLAARDPRVGACCVNGAPTNPSVPDFRTAREQIFSAVGLDDVRAAQSVLDTWRFDPLVQRLDCPLLLLHGARDPLATFEQQRGFLEAAVPGLGTLREWEDGEHTVYNHADQRDAFSADWFASHLVSPS